MKVLFFSLLFFLTVTVSYSQIGKDAIAWQDSFASAKKIAKHEDKAVLLFFTGSDWCGPCKSLGVDFFETKKFKEIANENFVLYEADFPRNKSLVTNEQWETNTRLSKKFNIKSFPAIVLLTKNGEKIAERKGYNLMRDPSYYFKLIESVSK